MTLLLTSLLIFTFGRVLDNSLQSASPIGFGERPGYPVKTGMNHQNLQPFSSAIIHSSLTASGVRRRLAPSLFPIMEGIDYHAEHRPAAAVGSDFYDLEQSPDGALTISVGDISGEETGSAILMSGLQAMLRTFTRRAPSHLGRVIQDLNRTVYHASPNHFYSTLFYARVDAASGQLQYASAGHEPALLVRKRTARVHWLESTGAVIGLTDRSAYGSRTLALEPGDTLVIFTDGITETADRGGKQFSYQGVLDVVHRYPDARAPQLAVHLMAAADDFGVSADDRTVVVVRSTGRVQTTSVNHEEALELAFAAA
jgi:sigma-B regulation protein RsbU (phosphoserine phosphatase)